MNEYNLSVGEGLTKVTLTAAYLGKDLAVNITAGRVHLGATAVAVPCQNNPEGVLASCSVITVPGHRDNIPAEAAALKLCKTLGCVVSVNAGLHIDKASQTEIATLVENSSRAVEALVNQLEGKNHGL